MNLGKKTAIIAIISGELIIGFIVYFMLYHQFLSYVYWYHEAFNKYVYAILAFSIIGFISWKVFKKNIPSGYIYFLEQLSNKFCTSASSSIGTMTLAGLSIAWASYVSLYANDLRSQFSQINFRFESLLFLVTIILAVVIAIFKEIGMQKQSLETEKRIKEEYSALPPQSVINLISKCITQQNKNLYLLKFLASELYKRSDVEIDGLSTVYENLIESVESAVESVISDMLNATKEWDNETNSNITYQINFFHLLNSKQLLQEYKKGILAKSMSDSINESKFFLYSDSFECKLKYSEYVLIGARNYSTCKDEKNKSPICLPFSSEKFEKANEYTQPNLAGAPNCLYSKRNEHIGDILRVFNDFCAEIENSGHLDLTKRYLKNIKEYYSKDNARSLFSMPIYRYSDVHKLDSSIGENPIGVLNIYADKKHMFKTRQKANAFYAIMSPIIHNLAELISLQIELTDRSFQFQVLPLSTENNFDGQEQES